MKTLVVILGPTASGKSALALKIATHFSTEILSADSRQFYRGLDIGTAKPSREELLSIPHHFINSISPEDEYNINRFEIDALECLESIFKKHDIAVMAGGSGLYINAVCEGLDELPDADPLLRKELNELHKSTGIKVLQDKLQKLDPEYFSVVDTSNPHRLIRAIEVCMLSGKKFSDLRSNPKKSRPFNIIKIGLTADREELNKRIDNRVDKMMADGLLKEAETFFPLRHLNALQTVGYQELFEYFEGKIELTDAINNIKQNTRKYAKRQLTWFKKDGTISWFEAGKELEVISFLGNKLNV